MFTSKSLQKQTFSGKTQISLTFIHASFELEWELPEVDDIDCDDAVEL